MDDDFIDINRIMRSFFGDSGFPGEPRRVSWGNRYEPNEDIMEDKENIYITRQLQGIEEDDIHLIPRENFFILYLITKQDTKTWKLPKEIDPKSMEYTFNNYVLDVTLKKVVENVNG